MSLYQNRSTESSPLLNWSQFREAEGIGAYFGYELAVPRCHCKKKNAVALSGVYSMCSHISMCGEVIFFSFLACRWKAHTRKKKICHETTIKHDHCWAYAWKKQVKRCFIGLRTDIYWSKESRIWEESWYRKKRCINITRNDSRVSSVDNVI